MPKQTNKIKQQINKEKTNTQTKTDFCQLLSNIYEAKRVINFSRFWNDHNNIFGAYKIKK
jgi:hypothetical protein